MTRRPPSSTLFPYTTLFRSARRPRSRRLTTRVAPASRRCSTRSTAVRRSRTRARSRLRRSEEHTSELQSRRDLVCRLLLEKKKKQQTDKLDTYIEHSDNYTY